MSSVGSSQERQVTMSAKVYVLLDIEQEELAEAERVWRWWML